MKMIKKARILDVIAARRVYIASKVKMGIFTPPSILILLPF